VLVVDASAAVHLALRDALPRLAPHEPVAPALLHSEATSALRQLAWRGDLDDAEAAAALERVVGAPIAVEPPGSLEREAYSVAVRLGWARIYDAEYVALAARHGCALLTTDARLARRAQAIVEIAPLESI
jgi:indolepyruvate ferredoxin oxidoreductase alpha subunit